MLMEKQCLFVISLLFVVERSLTTSTEPEKTVEYYTERCLDGVKHKEKPGPESELFSQCLPWKDRSCCTDETTEGLHVSPTWHNFDWNHCKQRLSSECEKWMTQDLCFYECSPNVGPWLVPHNISIRNERFVGVPLCRSECNIWFEACRYDLTCKENWAKGWDWSTGQNVCPADSQCQTFEAVYGNATNMCEKIWNGSFNVVNDTESCMVLWFNSDRPNPNEQVALRRAEELVMNQGSFLFSRLHVVGLVSFVTTLCLLWQQH
ncbi:folate receptor gamma-like [Diadema antillarum]|uniref:folate receptor gamma-like n=1 Tax=Diadema antillarum TaxID=105358 RepID=UPI003A8C3AB5